MTPVLTDNLRLPRPLPSSSPAPDLKSLSLRSFVWKVKDRYFHPRPPQEGEGPGEGLPSGFILSITAPSPQSSPCKQGEEVIVIAFPEPINSTKVRRSESFPYPSCRFRLPIPAVLPSAGELS